MLTLSLIAACARNRIIGRDNKMPWHLPADLKRFKAVTMSHPVIMGRKTFESILASLGKPLPGRSNIIVTRNAQFRADGCITVHSLEAALAACGAAAEAFVIGGGEIYRQALPLARRIYLTEIDAEFEGDARFPEFDKTVWRESARETHATGDAGLAYAFVTYENAAHAG
jgi:dihydrofolate reductase